MNDIELWRGDCLELMKDIPDKSVDMILCDLPYGTTQNKWDSVIPFDLLWEQYNRIIKSNGVIALFGSEPFTSKLICSNINNFKYNWVWQKNKCTGFLNAKKQPLREHEDIMVFYNKQPTYNPQMTAGKPCHSKGKAVGKANDDILNNSNYGNFKVVETKGDMKYPTSVWKFSKPHPSIALHPTQKPLDLCRYAIRTYTNEGDLVVDFCCGSGSILKAAQLENRNYIGMDNGICDRKGEFENWTWADVAKYRLKNMDR